VTGTTATSPESITRRPTTLSGGLSLVVGSLVLVLGALVSVPAIGPGVLGVTSLGLAVTYGRRRLADLGGVGLLLTTVAAGLSGSELLTLGCAVGAVLAWDLANNAIELGEQLGRETDTSRAELVHAGATLGVGLVTAGTSYVIYRSATGGQPVTAVFFLLLAAVALISSLRI